MSFKMFNNNGDLPDEIDSEDETQMQERKWTENIENISVNI